MSHQLRYSCDLAGPALFSVSDGDPNLVRSTRYIPGSAVWGALATTLIRKRNLHAAHTDSLFAQWFLRGGLRCLNAYCSAAVHNGEEPRRLLPVPLSVQRDKVDAHVLYDLVAYHMADQTCPVQTRRLDGFGTLEQGTVYLQDIEMQLNYHTSRPNRMKGRADEGEGAVFVYEALAPSQRFEGRILGEPEDLRQVCADLEWSRESPLSVQLGRSRATQYGGSVCLALLSAGPEPFTREVGVDTTDDGDAAGYAKGHLVLTLLSHMLLRDDLGYPTLQVPTVEVGRLLGLEPGELQPTGRFVARVTVGGYASVWSLPRPQWPACAAGSVFVFRVEGVDVGAIARRVQQAEYTSLGLRTEEGFGRFALNWHGRQLSLRRERCYARAAQRPMGEPPPQFNTLVHTMVERELLRAARQRGVAVADEFIRAMAHAGGVDGVSPALLGRLQLLFRTMQSRSAAQTQLDRYRSTASGQLKGMRDSRRHSLYDAITAVLRLSSDGTPPGLPSMSILLAPVTGNPAIVAVTKAADWDVEGDELLCLAVARQYLRSLFGHLSRHRRGKVRARRRPVREGEQP